MTSYCSSASSLESTPASSLRPTQPSSDAGSQKSGPPTHLYSRVPVRQLLPDGTPDYIKLILSSKVYDLVKETPLIKAVNLSDRLGVWIGMKREDLQPVFSFKVRGAYNLMAHLPPEERDGGTIACSAGNHAQGVAISAQALGVKATIVMPLATPSIKYKNVGRLGSDVVLHGNDFDDAKRECHRLASAKGLANIPPFDDPYVIAGQGTIGIEIMNQVEMSTLDAIFVCVGGGGLLAGVASYIKKIGPPGIKVIGVECHDQSAMTQSLLAGERVRLKEVGMFSDGTAVKEVGEETFRLCQALVDEMILVSNDELCAAIKDVFEDTRSIPEPAGALAVAGAKRYVQQYNLFGSGKRFVTIVSGANMNFDRLGFVAERANLDHREELTSGEKLGGRVKRPGYVHPFSGLLEKNQKDSLGMKARDISDSEMVKSPAQCPVDGLPRIESKRLICISFPESPGALHKFLVGLSNADTDETSFNISRFHYRNHGGDKARVFAGVQVPAPGARRFVKLLKGLGYSFTDETENEVYKDFLASSSN